MKPRRAFETGDRRCWTHSPLPAALPPPRLPPRDKALRMEPGPTDWNERLARVLVESSPDALVATAQDTRVLFWNEGARTIFGYSREEAMGRPLSDLIVPPDRAEEALGLLAQTLEAGSASSESVRRRKDGALVHVDITTQVVRDASGNVDY